MSEALHRLIGQLKAQGFSGDIETSYAERVVAATDNSIYQLMPQAILYPRQQNDIAIAARTVFEHRDSGYSLCARGGGTGTNGQALSDSLVLDCSRYLNRISTFDPEQQTVEVEPGVVLDQLNEFLQPHGLFFPIDISSSSRATLGGMVATDASGKGSLIYGKTCDHIQALDLVLADGNELKVEALSRQQLQSSDAGSLLQPLYQRIAQHRVEIDRVFPAIDRGMSGYNLKQAIDDQDSFNPCYLFAGSEGTLALTRKITLRVQPRPSHRMLTVVFYDDFQAGLDHVQQLLDSKPAAIEMLDDKILNLARNDNIWADVRTVLADLPDDTDIKAANFIEHVGFSDQELTEQQHTLEQVLQQTSAQYRVVLARTETDEATISALWNLRKRAVGLLGKMADSRKGTAFVEDTAVPAANLSAYVADFRKLLDQHGLDYGMYGHADAGVLHVRPALDLLLERDRTMIRDISDQVAALAKRHQGVIWGEHGRGFRGEYTPLFFGEQLYPLLCEIKQRFDPYNLLNPGKLTTPEPGQELTAVDAIALRGELDAQIGIEQRNDYHSSFNCNGNGACNNWQPKEAMCPSFKATRNKFYSPKGRAAMLREWLRLQQHGNESNLLAELEQDLYLSLQHCLSCKSCTSSCPVNVDIPELKSRFLQSWRQRHRDSMDAWFNRNFETLIALGRKLPSISNLLLHNPLGRSLLQGISGLNRLPKFSRGGYNQAQVIDNRTVASIRNQDHAVILLRDNYLHSFDQPSLQAAIDVLTKLGYRVYLSEPIHNGKLLHVKGYRQQFKQQANKVIGYMQALAETGLPLISCETVTRLMFDSEYPEILQQKTRLDIVPVESFILQHLQRHDLAGPENAPALLLLPHCQEQTQARQSLADWQAIFDQLGIDCDIAQPGCCGMSGLFGHEVINNQFSDDIFALYWQPLLQANTTRELVATGFSCRCQLENRDYPVQHPLQQLSRMLAAL